MLMPATSEGPWDAEGPSDTDETVGLVRESAAAVGARTGDLSRIRTLRFREPGYDPVVWSRICELGWIGLRRPGEAGRPDFGTRAFCALAEELGAGLVPEPVIPAAVAASLLPPEEADDVCAGRRLAVIAWQEEPGALDIGTACRFLNGRLSGRRVFVPFARSCDWFVVPTVDGPALVERNIPQVRLAWRPLQDGTGVGDLVFEDAPARRLDVDAMPALEAATLATAAYLLGVMERAFELSLDYLKAREQFGGPIGRFQVLRHQAVDLSIQIALTRASLNAAARVFDRTADRDRRRAIVSRAKARASEAALLVTRQAIQFHGALGYTDEADPGLFLRKAVVAAAQYGGARAHRRRFVDLSEGAAHA